MRAAAAPRDPEKDKNHANKTDQQPCFQRHPPSITALRFPGAAPAVRDLRFPVALVRPSRTIEAPGVRSARVPLRRAFQQGVVLA